MIMMMMTTTIIMMMMMMMRRRRTMARMMVHEGDHTGEKEMFKDGNDEGCDGYNGDYDSFIPSVWERMPLKL